MKHRQEVHRALVAAQGQSRDREAQITALEAKCADLRQKLSVARPTKPTDISLPTVAEAGN